MLTKVSDMVALVAQHPSLRVRILDGSRPGALSAALRGDTVGTLICAD
jgi:isopentenyl phosphate kinase